MKKGFTIIEILATITLMLLLAAIIVPSVMSVSKDVKEKEYKSIVESILISAREYGEDNINNFIGNNCLNHNVTASILKVSNLLEDGYLKGNKEGTMSDPRSNTDMNNMDVCVKYVNVTAAGRHKVIACLCTTSPCDCTI